MSRFTEEKRRFLVAHLGEARVRKMEEELEAVTKELEGRIRWKELGEALSPEEEKWPAQPAQKYVDDLTFDHPAEMIASAKAIGALSASQSPAAKYLIDLLTRGPQLSQGG